MIDDALLALHFGPSRALVDPRADDRDLIGTERLALRGHALVGIGRDDALIEQALRAVARDDERHVDGARRVQRAVANVEPQPRLLLRGSVTLVATTLENR